MARTQEVVETYTDDIDGSNKNIETLSFAVDGQAYEIDLGPKNARALRADLSRWTEHARKVRWAAGARRSRAVNALGGKSKVAAIRAWATENGIEVPARGRIPRSVAEP